MAQLAQANGFHNQESKLFDELLSLQQAILDGKKPQYRLDAVSIQRLKGSTHSVPSSSINTKPQPPAPRKPSPPIYHPSGLDPIFLQKSDSLVKAEQRLKRQRIERELFDQVERRKQVGSGERDAHNLALIDVDSVLAKAQEAVAPVSGIKHAVDEKSSFDENDYYSSQVESDWSAARKSKAFTADFEQLDVAEPPTKRARHSSVGSVHDMEDDYNPEEPLAGNDTDAYNGQVGEDAAASDYEPGEISVRSDEYTPEYAPPPVQSPDQPHVIRNHLTQIAAPQPSRVSPLAVHKSANYELELVDGRPEMVQKPRSRYDTDIARQSSASPPAGRKKHKDKKRKREVGQTRSKKRDRRSGLDTSAQYPQTVVKDEPVSPATFSTTHLIPQQYEQVAYAPHGQQFGIATQPRSSSVMAPRLMPRDDQDLRRVATLHAQQPPFPERQLHSPVASYINRPTTVLSVAENQQPSVFMPPPAPPKRVVVDQYGNRYYAADPAPAPAPTVQYERIPNSDSTQYDPTNARIEYIQPPGRTAATPSYTIDGHQLSRVRTQPVEAPRYAEQTSPAFDTRIYSASNQQFSQQFEAAPGPTHAQFTDSQVSALNGKPMQTYSQYMDMNRQAPPQQVYTQELGQRAYVQPEFAQPMQTLRQGSVAPVQYIRQGMQPSIQPQMRAMSVMPGQPQYTMIPEQQQYTMMPEQQQIRYIDANGYELQPSQMRQVSEYRPY